eukprot:TRINITY_DN62052_c0_g1_i1.p1 TRINITY_DN62052_c0_g1~~TRINITY_DN62052_c0_g1_i1.p1  ORF type:complete len:650 (+),score=49.23 TRINITY_DN62052_c0_g1_i1:293-1951(+)
MKVNRTCARVCQKKFTKKEQDKLKQRIEQGYRGNLLLDNLPVSEVYTQKMAGYRTFMLGYPLGFPSLKYKTKDINGKRVLRTTLPATQIVNHLAFTVRYHRPSDLAAAASGFRIVGFTVTPHSVRHSPEECSETDSLNKGWSPRQNRPVLWNDTTVDFTYSVTWIEDPAVPWSSRWDQYLSAASGDAKIHWFAIINSLLIVLFLSGMVAMILMRALHKDFNRYNDPDNEEEQKEETGWKLVHADVFRPPAYANYLAIYVGTGAQLFGMGFITIVFALLGFLSPANRGALLTASLLLYVLLGSYAGYISSRLCKTLKCATWWNMIRTATFFPGHVFTLFFLMNLALWAQKAANAVPFVTLITLLLLWLGVSLPLVIVGAVLGYKKEAIQFPTRVGQIERPIPEQKWYMKPPLVLLVSGILPFGAAFIELFFILSSIWLNRFYYVFGFLALVFLILTITCAQISVVMTYFQLCYEDHQWWWRAFLTSGSSGLHLFLYSIFYFFTTLGIRKFWATMVYFCWMLCMSYAFAIFTGSIGFMSSFVFVRHIYSRIKVD